MIVVCLKEVVFSVLIVYSIKYEMWYIIYFYFNVWNSIFLKLLFMCYGMGCKRMWFCKFVIKDFFGDFFVFFFFIKGIYKYLWLLVYCLLYIIKVIYVFYGVWILENWFKVIDDILVNYFLNVLI